MKLFLVLIVLGNLGLPTMGYCSEIDLVFDESILSGVEKDKGRHIGPTEISTEADFVANQIKVRDRIPSQAAETN